MVSKLPATWKKLHHQPATVIRNNTPQTVQQAAIHKVNPIDYTQYLTYSQDMISYTLSHEGKDYKFYIPKKVLDCFNDEFDYRFVSNCQELTDMAVAFLSGCLKRRMLQPEVVAEVRKASFRGETRTKTTYNGHTDALVLPVVR